MLKSWSGWRTAGRLAGAGLLLLSVLGCEPEVKPGPPLPFGPPSFQRENNPRVALHFDGNRMVVCELFEDEAPNTVANFISLAEQGFYSGLTIHKVIENQLLESGCPKNDGSGGPGYTIPDEFAKQKHRHTFGTLAMAGKGTPNSGGSRFFINLNRSPEGNARFNQRAVVFGLVVEGVEHLEELGKTPTSGPPLFRPNIPPRLERVEVIFKREHEYTVKGKVPDPIAPPASVPDKKTSAPHREAPGTATPKTPESGKTPATVQPGT
jgi:cyclophilin family peptidyl-prolyl cis-trans isomerase